VLGVVQGRAPTACRKTPYRDGVLTALPIVVSAGVVLMMGLYIPGPLQGMLDAAVKFLEVKP
jgi:hydrogenase-4 component F